MGSALAHRGLSGLVRRADLGWAAEGIVPERLLFFGGEPLFPSVTRRDHFLQPTLARGMQSISREGGLGNR